MTIGRNPMQSFTRDQKMLPPPAQAADAKKYFWEEDKESSKGHIDEFVNIRRVDSDQ